MSATDRPADETKATGAANDWYRDLRRRDRALDAKLTLALIDRAGHGVLSMAWPDGRPYAVPMSYGRDEDTIYMHCAGAGQKLDVLRQNPLAVLCVFDPGEVTAGDEPCEASVKYASALAFGRVREIADPERKNEALAVICRAHGIPLSPGEGPSGDMFGAKAGITLVLALDVEYYSGKANMAW